MQLKVLICPDKFKGTLTAGKAAEAIAKGWRKARPRDAMTLLPMSDGGDGFGEIISRLLGARRQSAGTHDAAHRECKALWWWEPQTRTAVIESALVIGLAQLPRGRFHPFELDTFGLGAVVQAAHRRGAKRCLIGIGGSATNDGGYGLARALGWEFLDRAGAPILQWTELVNLHSVRPPRKNLQSSMKVIVAVDVQNPWLGPRGASRVYGPQKGLRPENMPQAEAALSRLAVVLRQQTGRDCARQPGAGAAGGLGFGLMTFLRARPERGFHLFAKHAELSRRLRSADLVITGEGAIDRSTLMGKGVGELALLCRDENVPCIGLAGMVAEPKKAGKLFFNARGLTDLTSVEEACKAPAYWLEQLAREVGSTQFDFEPGQPR
jgi:glycerate 2-kinase